MRSATPSPTITTKMIVPHQSPVVTNASDDDHRPEHPEGLEADDDPRDHHERGDHRQDQDRASARRAARRARTTRAHACDERPAPAPAVAAPPRPARAASRSQRRASSTIGVPSIRLARAISQSGSSSVGRRYQDHLARRDEDR